MKRLAVLIILVIIAGFIPQQTYAEDPFVVSLVQQEVSADEAQEQVVLEQQPVPVETKVPWHKKLSGFINEWGMLFFIALVACG